MTHLLITLRKHDFRPKMTSQLPERFSDYAGPCDLGARDKTILESPINISRIISRDELKRENEKDFFRCRLSYEMRYEISYLRC